MALPAHTPTADMLVMTYGEPDDIAADSPLNTTKVGWALTALTSYLPCVVHATNVIRLPQFEEAWHDTDAETLLVDLIADLMHLATFTGCDPEEILRMSRVHFEAEVGRGYDQ